MTAIETAFVPACRRWGRRRSAWASSTACTAATWPCTGRTRRAAEDAGCLGGARVRPTPRRGGPDRARVPRLAPLAENLRRLEAAGIDGALPRFDPPLRSLTPEKFLPALAPSIALRMLVMTPASAFGRNRAGTPDAMRAHGRTAGFDLVLAEPVMDGGGPISSARVRAALAAGDIAEATRLLGHPPFLAAAGVETDAAAGARFRALASIRPGPPGSASPARYLAGHPPCIVDNAGVRRKFRLAAVSGEATAARTSTTVRSHRADPRRAPPRGADVRKTDGGSCEPDLVPSGRR